MNDSTAVPKNTKSFFAVPSQSVRRAYLQAVVLFCLLFAAVYGGADYLAGLRNNRLRVDFAFEQNLPFVAELSPVYSSLYFMFLTVPFVVRRKEQVWSYARTMAAITVVAGICFLLLPAELAFRLPTRDRDLPLFFRLADWLNLTYNLCPSLHVAYAVYHAEFLRKQISSLWLDAARMGSGDRSRRLAHLSASPR